jgi:hypothetical protein
MPSLEKRALLDDAGTKNLTFRRMKSSEFNLPKKEVETEAETHAEETRRAVSAASKGRAGRKKMQPKGRRSAK